MENRAKTIVLGILVLGTLSACSGADDSAPPKTADAGGLDGGGSIAVGLSWDKGVFVQPTWVDGEPFLLVSNQRADDVSFGVFAIASGGDQYGSEVRLTRGASLTEAVVPARTTRTLDAAALLGNVGDVLWVSVDDELLGLMFRPQPPSVSGTLPVISSDWRGRAQIETDFSLLPGTSLEATVTLARPGQLRVHSSSSPTADVAFLPALSASSEEAMVTATTDGFLAEIPDGTSEANPAYVQLSFSAPVASASESALVALDIGSFCVDEPNTSECESTVILRRFVPTP